MKKIKLLRIFIFATLFLIISCREEADWTNNQQQSRAAEFFKNNHHVSTNFKNANITLVSGTILKLRKMNDKIDFISKLSDQKGLPAWNFLKNGNVRKYNKILNKGNESAEMMIIPLITEEGFLTSLMYVENFDSENPNVYTVTNGQLEEFSSNTNIDSSIRESVLMTFIYFDNGMFGSRLYSSIPLDLFENVPAREGKDYKTFAVGNQGTTSNLDGEMCFPVFDCKNGLDEAHCDGCPRCVFQVCFNSGGGGPIGDNGGGPADNPPDNPNNPYDPTNTGGGSGGQTNPNVPWYLQNQDIDIFSYSPNVQSIFQSLTDFGYVLGTSHLDFLQQNNTIAMKFRNYLVSNTLIKSQNAILGINFFIDNPGATWQQFLNLIPKTPCEKISKVGKNIRTKDLFGILKPKVNSTKEFGYILAENSGTVSEDPIEGNTGEHSISFSVNIPIDGFIHSHYIGLLSVFSVSDMFALAQLYKSGKIKDVNSFVIGVVTASNTQYLMVIDDPTKFGAFADNLFEGNEIDQNVQNMYEFVYAGFGIKTNNTAINNESSFLSYLQTNKTGLRLLKGDSTFSNWQILSKDSNGNVIPQNCP